MKTPPILFLIFNRPDLTRRVFDRIREAQPSQLFVAADGPRPDRPGEAALCAEARAIVDRVDWLCEIHTLFRDENLGCKIAVGGAITWFFEQVDEGIILEDDCLPDLSFFTYCAELLDRYRNSEKVMMISGDNFQDSQPYKNRSSYYFSVFPLIWGWATWSRAWRYYDSAMSKWLEKSVQNEIRKFLGRKDMFVYWARIFDRVHAAEIDTWDYQWTYSCWVQQGLTVLPRVNLISNIGFDRRATHTQDSDNKVANLIAHSIPLPLTHPHSIVRDYSADQHVFNHHFKGMTKTHTLSYRVILREALPPIVHRLISHLYRQVKWQLRQITTHKPKLRTGRIPDWHVVSHGPLRGYRLFVDASMPAFQEMLDGTYDQYFWNCLAHIDLDRKTVLDIGGHIGYHTLVFAKLVGPSGAVHVFEPNPHNYARMQLIIKENVDLARTITLHSFAVSEREGTAKFNFSSNIDDQTSSGSYIEGSHKPLEDKIYAQAGFSFSEVMTTTIDAFVESHKLDSVTLVKIDVEGAEHLVIRGAKETLLRFCPYLLIEIHAPEAFISVCEILIPLNYHLNVLYSEDNHRFFLVCSPPVNRISTPI